MKRDEAPNSNDTAAAPAPDGELHRPPSVLWLVVPLLLIVIYAATR